MQGTIDVYIIIVDLMYIATHESLFVVRLWALRPSASSDDRVRDGRIAWHHMDIQTDVGRGRGPGMEL